MDGPRWPLDRQTGRWLVALATLGLACVAMPHAAPRQLDSTPRVVFARDILPIFEAKCTACHGPTLQESRLRLDSAEAIWRGGLAGHAVIPGDADASPLMRRLLGTDEPLMPFGGDPLPDDEVALVRRWIETAEFQFAASLLSLTLPYTGRSSRESCRRPWSRQTVSVVDCNAPSIR